MNKVYYIEQFAKMPTLVWRESEQKEVRIWLKKFVEEHSETATGHTIRKLYIEK